MSSWVVQGVPWGKLNRYTSSHVPLIMTMFRTYPPANSTRVSHRCIEHQRAWRSGCSFHLQLNSTMVWTTHVTEIQSQYTQIIHKANKSYWKARYASTKRVKKYSSTPVWTRTALFPIKCYQPTQLCATADQLAHRSFYYWSLQTKHIGEQFYSCSQMSC